jgi:dephospho-CoA kinase
MITLGLTGSIGMGKSTVAAMFADEGVPVFDADAAVHRLQGPGGAIVAAIEQAFPGTTGAAGVDRKKLGEAVFGDSARLKRLEAIVHPLLFEAEGWRAVDKVAVVSAPPEIQRARVLARPGMTPARFESILARQLPDAEKRARADFVIPTGGTIAQTRAAVRDVIACLARGAGG